MHALLSLCVLLLITLSGCTRERSGLMPVTENQLSHSRFENFSVVRTTQTSEGPLAQLKEKEDTLFVQHFKVSAPEAQKWESARKTMIASQYQTRTTPYPGAITNVSECAALYQPKPYNFDSPSLHAVAFEMFASDRFTFGACLPGQIQYRAVYAMIYCRDSGIFFDVKIFFANHEAALNVDELLKGFSCHAP